MKDRKLVCELTHTCKSLVVSKNLLTKEVTKKCKKGCSSLQKVTVCRMKH